MVKLNGVHRDHDDERDTPIVDPKAYVSLVELVSLTSSGILLAFLDLK